MRVFVQIITDSKNTALLIYSVAESLENAIETTTWPPLLLNSEQIHASFAFILNRNNCMIDTVMFWRALINVGENKYLPVDISFEHLFEPIDYTNPDHSLVKGFSAMEEICAAAAR